MNVPEEAQVPLKALRVLVVEDNAVIGMLYADLLVELGYIVCAIEATEAGAIAAAVHCKPDLMIVDAVLDGGSGISAVDEILRTKFVPHVFVSGDAASVRAVRPGAMVMQKPFRDLELGYAIQRTLARARQA